jgi:hypothetical protein
MDEWRQLILSNSGERGIVNVESFPDKDMRFNPCSERILRDHQACNLSSVVIEKDILYSEIARRVKLATLIGTIQASLTKFNNKILSKSFTDNTIKDAMLGISMTGTSNRRWMSEELEALRDYAINCNKKFSKLLGINEANGITCIKPEGTVSQVVGTSSGIHPDYAPFYIRRVRVSANDPMCNFLIYNCVPHKPEVGTDYETTDTMVFEFPVKSTSTRLRENQSAIDQLEYYLLFKKYWCDERGNPSCTIYVKENEWLEVLNWVYKNWNDIGGLSFLPYDTGVYQLAPYEEITKEQFNKMVETFPDIDFSKLSMFENEDMTTGAKSLNCSAGQCDI